MAEILDTNFEHFPRISTLQHALIHLFKRTQTSDSPLLLVFLCKIRVRIAEILIRSAMGSQEKLDKMTLRQNYRNLWHTDLMSAISADPAYCCLSVWCSPCVSYMLRKRALYGDMSRYTCCGGYMPCSGKCGEHKCPEFCLGTEVFLCFGSSVASTRFLLQDEFNIQTTPCDNCIIGFMFCLQQIACIFSIVAMIVGSDEIAEASQMLSCLADLVYCSVCACMQTQHKVEMDKRDGMFGSQTVTAVPPVQQMSRFDQSVPPPALAYPQPPPPAYGYPQPPPQAYGYPQPPPPGYGQGYGYYPPGPPHYPPPSQAK